MELKWRRYRNLSLQWTWFAFQLIKLVAALRILYLCTSIFKDRKTRYVYEWKIHLSHALFLVILGSISFSLINVRAFALNDKRLKMGDYATSWQCIKSFLSSEANLWGQQWLPIYILFKISWMYVIVWAAIGGSARTSYNGAPSAQIWSDIRVLIHTELASFVVGLLAFQLNNYGRIRTHTQV